MRSQKRKSAMPVIIPQVIPSSMAATRRAVEGSPRPSNRSAVADMPSVIHAEQTRFRARRA